MSSYKTINHNLNKWDGADYHRRSEFNDNFDIIDTALGKFSDLTTAQKSSLVLAINEVLTKIGNVANLNTTDKTQIVNAINEVLLGLNTHKASSDHDSRYYTESEVNTFLSGKSDVGHNHDSSYYTQSQTYTKAEIDTALAGKSNTGHNHDDRYYTESEVDTALDLKADKSQTYTKPEVDTALSGKSNTGHNHDDRYFTETEIGAKLDMTNGAIASINNVANAKGNINLVGGTGITISVDSATKQITITATGEAIPGPHASSHAVGGSDVITLEAEQISDFGEAAQDVIGSAISAGTQTNITISYDDVGNKFNFEVQDGTTLQKGVVQLEDSISSNSTSTAATPNSVKTVNDALNAHLTDFTQLQSDVETPSYSTVDFTAPYNVLSSEARDALFAELVVRGNTLTNLCPDSDMETTTNKFAAYGSAVSIENGWLKTTGNVSSIFLALGMQNISFLNGKVYFLRMLTKVSAAVTDIAMAITKSDFSAISGTKNVSILAGKLSGELYAVFTCTADITNARVYAQAKATETNGISLFIDKAAIYEITATERDALSFDQLAMKYPYVKTGTQSSKPGRVRCVTSKNLVNIQTQDVKSGRYESWVGSFIPNLAPLVVDISAKSITLVGTSSGVLYYRLYPVKVKQNTQYRFKIKDVTSQRGAIGVFNKDFTAVLVANEDTRSSTSISKVFDTGTNDIILVGLAPFSTNTVTFEEVMLIEESVVDKTYISYSATEVYWDRELSKVGSVADEQNVLTGAGAQRNSDWVTLDGSFSFSTVQDGTGWKNLSVSKSSVAPNAKDPMTTSNTMIVDYLGRVNALRGFSSSGTIIYIGLDDAETGFPEDYSPSGGEWKAYFYGWKMCNSDGSTPYSGTGTKYWKKITDGTGLTSTLPTASYSGYTPYKIKYQYAIPTSYSVAPQSLRAAPGALMLWENKYRFIARPVSGVLTLPAWLNSLGMTIKAVESVKRLVNGIPSEVAAVTSNTTTTITLTSPVDSDYEVVYEYPPEITPYPTISGKVATNIKGQADSADAVIQNANEAVNDALSAVNNIYKNDKQFMSRQAIINGNFDVWQRDVSFINPTSYTADRWMVAIANTGILPTITISRQLLSGEIPASFYYYRITVDGAGSGFGTNDVYNFARQRIENGVRYLCGAGKKITISFWARSSIPNKKIGIKLVQLYGTGGSPSSTEIIPGTTWVLTSTWTKYTYTFTTNTLTGKTFGTNSDDFLELSFACMWGTARAIEVGDTVAETFVGAGNIDIAQVQVCTGDVALPFVPRSFNDELLSCMRYFERSYDINTSITSFVTQGIESKVLPSNTIDIQQQYGKTSFKVPKRIVPTVTIYPYTTPTNTGRVSANDGTDLAENSGKLAYTGHTGFGLFNDSGSTLTTVNNTIIFHWTADAEL